jgi:hypothetical protein
VEYGRHYSGRFLAMEFGGVGGEEGVDGGRGIEERAF